MRWSLHIPKPALRADKAESITIGPDAEGRRASLQVAVEGAELVMRIDAAGRPGARRPDFPEWYYREHIVVFLNPGNDQATRWLYSIDAEGQVLASAETVIPGEEVSDTFVRALPAPPPATGSFERLGNESDARFRATLRWPLSAFNDHAHTGLPLGLRVKVGFHEEIIPDPLHWPGPIDWAGDAAMGFGHLFLAPPRLQVSEIIFRQPAWSPYDSEILFRLAAPAPAASGRARLTYDLPTDSVLTAHVSWHAQDSTLLRVTARFPSRAKWPNSIEDIARLGLDLHDESGVFWRGAFPFAIDAGVIVRERYGAPAPAPGGNDPDMWRARLLAQIPNYRARTTADGAPSDFFLEDPSRNASINLSSPNAIDDVAEFLARTFPKLEDALFAVALWTHHPLVTRHSGSWSRVSGAASVATLPKLGGCFCNDVSRLCAALAEKVGARLKVPVTGCVMGLRGHLTTLVATPERRVVIDGMLGMAFPTLDHLRLASLEEMRADARIAKQVWSTPHAHGHEFFFGIGHHPIRPWRDGTLVWPHGDELR